MENEYAYSDDKAIRQLLQERKNSKTSFNTHVADSTTSVVSLPSTFNFNSERFELVQEGTVDDTDFTDNEGEYSISVNGNSGDAHEFRAKQRVEYTPNYELLVGLAYYMENQLSDGQRLIIKFADKSSDNGYFAVIENDRRYSYIKSNGSKIDETDWGQRQRTQDVYPKYDNLDETQPQILRKYLSWYGDGAKRDTLSFANQKAQMQNKEVSRCANTSSVSTNEINLFMSIRLECTSSTTSNTLNVLSMGAVNRGSESDTNRQKPSINFNLGGNIGTSYTPVLALRKRSSKKNVPTELEKMTVLPTTKMAIIAVAFPSGSTDASSWDIPPEQDGDNTSTEETDSITSFPTDGDGNPDGRLLDGMIALSGGKGNSTEENATDIVDPIYDDDEIVFLAKAESGSGESLDLTYRTQQRW